MGPFIYLASAYNSEIKCMAPTHLGFTHFLESSGSKLVNNLKIHLYNSPPIYIEIGCLWVQRSTGTGTGLQVLVKITCTGTSLQLQAAGTSKQYMYRY